MILSSQCLYLTPVQEVPHTVRDVFGVLKGWEPDKVYYTRNSSGIVKNVDLQSSTVTSESMLMGAERVGAYDNKANMLTADDRALLQGFSRKVRYPPGFRKQRDEVWWLSVCRLRSQTCCHRQLSAISQLLLPR